MQVNITPNSSILSSAPIEFLKDGIPTIVSQDTITPANSIPLPVQLYGVTGQLNITAGDLNVQTSHLGANYDSLRIGDGTTLLGITVANEAKVSDATLAAKDFATQTTLAAMSAKLPAVLGQTTLANSLSVALASNQTLPLPTGAATEATLAALNAKFSALGQNTMANSVPVVPSSDYLMNALVGVLDANNSTTTPLGIGGVFTGVATDLLQYAEATIALAVDRSGTLRIEYSQDTVNWDHDQPYTITVATPGVAEGFQYTASREARYFRIVYTNGATAQAVMRLQTILSKTSTIGEIHRIDQPVLGNTDAIVTKGVIYGLTTGGGGGYVAVKVNPSGALSADVTSNSAFVATETTLAALNAKFGSLGQKAMAGSAPVVIASDQAAYPVKSDFLSVASNSSTTPLGIGGVFTGTAIDTSGYTSISVLIFSDVASAANGVLIEYSGDGTNWDEATVATHTPGTSPNAGQVYGGNIRARYARVVYTNGGTAQAAFRLATTLRATTVTGDMVDLEAPLGLNNHAMLTKSLITGKTTAGDGSFVDVKVNPSGALTVDATQSGTWNITNISGTVSLPTGAATEATLSAMSAKLPATLGQKTAANSMSVVLASDQGTVTVNEAAAGTSAVTSVASSVTSVSLLASNASRKGFSVFNESTAVLYLKLGATASATSYTVQVAAGGYYEHFLTKVYSGAVDGIWTAANGSARITELT